VGGGKRNEKLPRRKAEPENDKEFMQARRALGEVLTDKGSRKIQAGGEKTKAGSQT